MHSRSIIPKNRRSFLKGIKKHKRRLCFLAVFLLFQAAGWAGEAKDDFTYDSRGKKDPFLPSQPVWTPERTATRLRESFLDGVMWDNGKSLAIIDGKILKKGDGYLCAVLETIEKDRAVFRVGDEKITVVVAPPLQQEGKSEK